ncbi:peptidoglycan DD-metalloendopeptidase family protein [Streptomyces sp. NPDC059816]|uniref:peptidoglycan DD-metalloendopeptidase family protein n=1 Tax=Streptomyces sp. NPDC059816 TaxID=3346960 RepID=UPI0036581149
MVAAALSLLLLPIVLVIGLFSQVTEPPETGTGSGGLNSGAVPEEYVKWVLKAGALCDEIPPAVIAAQIEAESGWNPNAVSFANAQGLSQFIPGTWATWGRDDDGNGTISPFDPGDAIMAQGRYDCALVDQVRPYANSGNLLDLTLAAYNAGPGRVQQYRGVPPYSETIAYVARIKSLMGKYEGAVGGGGKIPPGQQMAMPLAGNPQVTSPYGYRMHPVLHVRKLHTGIDFAAGMGDPMKAARDGEVTFAGWSNGYGNRVVISHGTLNGQRVNTTYSHMSAISVSEGERVRTGQQIGAVGSTGFSTGAHCHFEVQVNDGYVNPAPWLGI